jgi:CBS domain-containing protein
MLFENPILFVMKKIGKKKLLHELKYKWIFCGGMLRSGSTLQYNIAAELVERYGVGRREIWVDDHIWYFQNANPNSLTVFKSHFLSNSVDHQFHEGRAVGLITFRDIRDATASWQAKNRMPLSMSDAIDFAETAVRLLDPWEKLPRELVYFSKYEDTFSSIYHEAKNIADWLKLRISDSDLEDINEKLSVDSMKRMIKNTDEKSITISGANSWNTNTLIHIDHMNGGAVGRYKNELSSELIEELSQRHGDWLLAHGYEI